MPASFGARPVARWAVWGCRRPFPHRFSEILYQPVNPPYFMKPSKFGVGDVDGCGRLTVGCRLSAAAGAAG